MKKISVLILTYNHEKYIRQALDSVLEQQTSFSFEIIISDDCSTDDTPTIILEYKNKFPQIIILENSCNKGITKNLQRGLKACEAEYVAILEGDDYWNSSKKLQDQAAFLDQNPHCSMVFNDLLTIDAHDIFKNSRTPHKPSFTTHELIKDNIIRNFSTCMYRNKCILMMSENIFGCTTYDWFFNITISQQGLVGFLPQQMTVHRIHEHGVWSSKKQSEQAANICSLIPHYDAILEFKHTKSFQLAYETYACLQFKNLLQERQYKNAFACFKKHPGAILMLFGKRGFKLLIPYGLVKLLKKLKQPSVVTETI